MHHARQRHHGPTPWSLMGLTRQGYVAARPWEAAQLPRDWFEEIIRGLTPDLFADFMDI